MSDNMSEFLVFPVRAGANAGSSQNTPNSFCTTCGAQLTPQDMFCTGCGTQVQGGSQPYQQSQASPTQWQPTENIQPVSQAYSQPQMPQPTANYQKSSISGSSKTIKKSDRTSGIILLGIGAALFVGWLIMKIAASLEWWEGLIPFVFGTHETLSFLEGYKTDWGATILSFISPFLLWGAGLLLLCGLGSFLSDPKDK